MKLRSISLTFGFLSLVTVIACGGGGGGGGGGIIDPANEPTCPFTATEQKSSTRAERYAALQGPDIMVPESTLGVDNAKEPTAHTNHLVYTGATGRGSGPTGLTPVQVRTAYGVPAGAGAGAIAIVDAYHYPTALNDFNVFSTQFSLPTESSGNVLNSSNTVLQVVYATGTQPATNASWSQEAALDIQWAHAMAPNAKIYLVEAASATVSDLMDAVNVAKALPGVKQVSMSFGALEDPCFLVHYNSAMLQSGVVFFAASGDTANERNFPAVSRNVVAVGGTTLTLTGTNERLNETVWNKTGSGLSQYEPRQTFQNVVVSQVQRYRGVADISAVADPNTGVSVYDSTPSGGVSGWLIIGGTSASSPIIAGMQNAAGTSYSNSKEFNAHIYGQIGGVAFFDVVSGAAGLHAAGTGWDYPTGVGSPIGLSGL